MAAALRAMLALLFWPTWPTAVNWPLLLDERSLRQIHAFASFCSSITNEQKMFANENRKLTKSFLYLFLVASHGHVWPFSTQHGLALFCMVFYGIVWPFYGFVCKLYCTFMAKYRCDLTCIVFSRGHRSKFIWSCSLNTGLSKNLLLQCYVVSYIHFLDTNCIKDLNFFMKSQAKNDMIYGTQRCLQRQEKIP